MSTTTKTETVTVPREAMLDACAALIAAGEVLTSLNGACDIELGEFFMNQGWELKRAAFGPPGDDDESFSTNPVTVETDARAYEMAAGLLADLHRPSQLERLLDDDHHYELKMRSSHFRKLAEEFRTNGSIDGRFSRKS